MENSVCAFCGYNPKKEESKVVDMVYGAIYLNFDQKYTGRCLYIPHTHHDLFENIDPDLHLKYSKEIFIAANNIKKAMNADLINIATLCNVVRHVHWHIIPRYEDDPNWGNPPWGVYDKRVYNIEPKIVSEKDLEEIKNKIINSFL